MGKPHVHAELIKAWADGAEIEFFNDFCSEWRPLGANPQWFEGIKFRIKPEPKPDVVRFVTYEWNPVNQNTIGGIPSNTQSWYSNLKLTFNGETGKLKSAEVL